MQTYHSSLLFHDILALYARFSLIFDHFFVQPKATKSEDSAAPSQKKRGRTADVDPKFLKKRLKQMFLVVKNYQVCG